MQDRKINSDYPLISVIVPVYNAAQYLEGMIDSIISQSFSDLELMLLDDGSSDGSAEICDKYAEKDRRIEVIHKENEGISATRNLGIERAKGKYLCFCDHDDFLMTDALKNLYEAIENTKADMIHGATPVRYSAKCKKEVPLSVSKIDFDSAEEDIFDRYAEVFTLCQTIWGALYRTEYIIRNNIEFPLKYTSGGEDAVFFFRILQTGARIKCISQEVYIHILRDGQSASSRYSLNFLLYHFEFSEEEYTYLSRYGKAKIWLQRWFFFFRQVLLLLSDPNSGLSYPQKKEYLMKYLQLNSSQYAMKHLTEVSDVRISNKFLKVSKLLLRLGNPYLLLLMGKAGQWIRKNIGGNLILKKRGTIKNSAQL